MKTGIILFLISLSCYGAGFNFAQQPMTNTVQEIDLLLLDSQVSGGTGYKARTTTASNFMTQTLSTSNFVTTSQLATSNYISPGSTFIISGIPILPLENSSTNIPHTLGAVPVYLELFLVCTNFDSGVQYPVGTKLGISSVAVPYPWFSLGADATKIKLVTDTGGGSMRRLSDGTYFGFAHGKWTITIIAKSVL